MVPVGVVVSVRVVAVGVCVSGCSRCSIGASCTPEPWRRWSLVFLLEWFDRCCCSCPGSRCCCVCSGVRVIVVGVLVVVGVRIVPGTLTCLFVQRRPEKKKVGQWN